MLLFGHNHEIYKKIFPSVFWNFSETKTKKIFLTFDDGPNSEVTTRVLDILDKYNAKATFFCLGENVEKHPELYKSLEMIFRQRMKTRDLISGQKQIGRNDKCPCGSGEKFKNCCGKA